MIKLLIRNQSPERSQKEARKYGCVFFFLKKVWGVDCQIGTPLPQEDGLQLFSLLRYN